ncbi:recombinase family protein [bacterium]|nr:recombinase family protein [bacterium]
MPDTNAALYIRVSTRQQAEEGFSLEDQQRVLTELAQDRGWSFRLYIDAGISGERIENRPALLDLLNSADEGSLDVVAIVDESRLARDELTAAVIRDRLKRAGITLATPSGDRDLSDPSGSFVATVLGAASALEQDLRTAKMSAGLLATARAGFWMGGPPPFGYNLAQDPAGSRHKVLVVNEGEAGVIREAASLILDHAHSTWTATEVLNGTGNFTRSGKPWFFQNLAFQLKKEHLTGTFTYNHSTGPVTFKIPPILTQARWDAVQAVIRALPGSKAKNKFYPLTGYLKCECGGSISGVYRKEYGRRYYKCSRVLPPIPKEERCPHFPRYLSADHLEVTVWEAIYGLLTDPDRLEDAAKHHLTAAQHAKPQNADQRATIARRLDELDLEEVGVIRTHARDQITDTQLAASLDQIQDERRDLRNHLDKIVAWERRATKAGSQLSQLKAIAADAQERLADTDPPTQRRIYELLQLEIRLTPERTLDIHGSIPTNRPLTIDSELSIEAPQDP